MRAAVENGGVLTSPRSYASGLSLGHTNAKICQKRHIVNPGGSGLLGRLVIVPYTWFMTRALDAVIAKLAILPPEEQDRVARWLRDELRDEEHWTDQFKGSQNELSKLAAEARAERAAGRTTTLDPEKL